MRSLASVLHDVSSLFNLVFYDYMLPTISFFINLYIEKSAFRVSVIKKPLISLLG